MQRLRSIILVNRPRIFGLILGVILAARGLGQALYTPKADFIVVESLAGYNMWGWLLFAVGCSLVLTVFLFRRARWVLHLLASAVVMMFSAGIALSALLGHTSLVTVPELTLIALLHYIASGASREDY